MVDRIAHNLIYAGIIKGKWTNNKPVKAQFEGIVSVDLFNKANHDKLIIEMIETSWRTKQQQRVQNDQRLIEQRQALEAQIRVMVDRMKTITSETALKYMGNDIEDAEKQIKELDSKLANKAEEEVDIVQILQYARYLLKHLSELILDLSNPLRKAAFLWRNLQSDAKLRRFRF